MLLGFDIRKKVKKKKQKTNPKPNLTDMIWKLLKSSMQRTED